MRVLHDLGSRSSAKTTQSNVHANELRFSACILLVTPRLRPPPFFAQYVMRTNALYSGDLICSALGYKGMKLQTIMFMQEEQLIHSEYIMHIHTDALTHLVF